MKKDLKDLLPKHKSDIDAIRKLEKYTFEEIEQNIPYLLEWTQDLNWEIALPTAQLLLPYFNQLTNYLIPVLSGTDDCWKYSILSLFEKEFCISKDKKLLLALKRIKDHPTKSEKKEGVSGLINQILA